MQGIVIVPGSRMDALWLDNRFAMNYSRWALLEANHVAPQNFRWDLHDPTCWRYARDGSSRRLRSRSRLQRLSQDIRRSGESMDARLGGSRRQSYLHARRRIDLAGDDRPLRPRTRPNDAPSQVRRQRLDCLGRAWGRFHEPSGGSTGLQREFRYLRAWTGLSNLYDELAARDGSSLAVAWRRSARGSDRCLGADGNTHTRGNLGLRYRRRLRGVDDDLRRRGVEGVDVAWARANDADRSAAR